MSGRLKFQVWSDKFQRWKTAYVLVTMLHENLILAKARGLKVRIGSRKQRLASHLRQLRASVY